MPGRRRCGFVLVSFFSVHATICSALSGATHAVQAARANGCFAFTAHEEHLGGTKGPCVAEGILTCEVTGRMSMPEYLAMLALARTACVRIAAFNKAGLGKAFQPP